MSEATEGMMLMARVVLAMAHQMTPDGLEAAAAELREQAESESGAERKFLAGQADGLLTYASDKRAGLA